MQRPRATHAVLLLSLAAPSGGLAQTCPTDTTRGTLTVEVTPGPNGEPLTVAVTGPANFSATVTATATYPEVSTGSYRARVMQGERVIVDGTPVGRAFSPLVRGTGCVRAGATARLTAGYVEEPGSHKLWIVDDMGNAALAVGPEFFATAGSVAPAARLGLGTNKAHAIAFDPAGNLWIADISGQVMSFGVWTLGRAGAARPRTAWTGPTVADPIAMAFDAAGGLWIASRQGRVMRFGPAQLDQARATAPQVTLTVPEPTGLAFDARGNLWVASTANGSALLRYDAHRLEGANPGPPDATVVAMSPPPVIDVLRGPAGMAFDRDGNLWVGYFGPNVVARLTPRDLRASGEVTPGLQLGLTVGALLAGLAFDESGALWVPGESGRVFRLAPEQLRKSGVVTPHALEPEGLRYAVGLAVNPPVSWARPGSRSGR